MSMLEVRLRPAVEFVPAGVSAAAAGLILAFPEQFLLPLEVSRAAAAMLTALALLRLWQGGRVVAFRRRLRRPPDYMLRPEDIHVSDKWLFLGRGFEW
ncbi:MAG: conjugative coupling factor TraD, PFGI-1 class, partial [Mariprofundaceae bacterium]